ncbi:hypothetical protein CVT26_012387 [Gymnopilus dilepis]|uniref:Uncharacterized protein n=1 Tax=Gymnopilus dilepis TaxID=231916 RepID=A0A409WVN4_9AGAR|nr:hypothetical protein CVT26_012387 [Gymnopilus dilepis]
MPLALRTTGVHSLPIELLSIVFLLGASYDDPYADGPFLLKPEQEYKPVPSSNFQVVVSHVCQHWRLVALSIPTLWTTLHFTDPSHLSRAKTYLSRCSSSQNYLLDVLVETVHADDHVPGRTLYNEELDQIFHIIIPHIKRWRAFHLKISDNDCKGTARLHLGTCGGAPHLETLQLYHFEHYRTSQSLYLATFRPPVIIFGNSLPKLRNISLIGVNLAWENSPYLTRLHQLELALHRESVRPVYQCWDAFLRSSPDLEVLCLHYSGPRDPEPGDPSREWFPRQRRIRLERLRELSLTDLDPENLCEMVRRLCLPGLRKLSLDLPEQDYTPFIDLLTTPASPSPASSPASSPPPSPTTSTAGSSHEALLEAATTATVPKQPNPILSLSSIETLIIHSLECTLESWTAFLRAAVNLRKLKVNFGSVGVDFWDVFTRDCEPVSLGEDKLPVIRDEEGAEEGTVSRGEVDDASVGANGNANGNDKSTKAKATSTPTLLLPHLEKFELSGISGDQIIAALRYRHRFRARQRLSSFSSPSPSLSTSTSPSPPSPYATPPPNQEWTIGFSRARREQDPLLDVLLVRGFWLPECAPKGSLREEDRVLVGGYVEEGEEGEEEEEEEEDVGSDGEEEDEDEEEEE